MTFFIDSKVTTGCNTLLLFFFFFWKVEVFLLQVVFQIHAHTIIVKFFIVINVIYVHQYFFLQTALVISLTLMLNVDPESLTLTL